MKSAKLQPGLSALPKSGKGRPRKSIAVSVNELEDIKPDSNAIKSARNLKDQLTEKELKFIEIYMLGEITKEKAMELAGYTGYHQRWVYYLAAKIIQKYESRAEDHRKIARAIGAGEVTVLRGLLELAQNARAEAVRCKAWEALASCLGLKSEPVESFQGMQIVIRGMEPGDVQVGGQAAGTKPAPATVIEAQQITK